MRDTSQAPQPPPSPTRQTEDRHSVDRPTHPHSQQGLGHRDAATSEATRHQEDH
jgi:hypothetical protein